MAIEDKDRGAIDVDKTKTIHIFYSDGDGTHSVETIDDINTPLMDLEARVQYLYNDGWDNISIVIAFPATHTKE